jgi:hypothetical protein
MHSVDLPLAQGTSAQCSLPLAAAGFRHDGDCGIRRRGDPPSGAGDFWGPQSFRGLTFNKGGFSYRMADRPGATARFVTSLENLGAHSVKVTSIDTGDVATDMRWSVYRAVPGGLVSGVRTPWQRFPAVVAANGTIRLLITIHRPADCAAYAKVGGVSTAIPADFSSSRR